MHKDKCDHKWAILRETGPIAIEGRGGEMYPAVFKCNQCELILTASEALQLSALKNQNISLENQTKLAKHQLGFQKWLSVSAFIVSIIAILIAWLK